MSNIQTSYLKKESKRVSKIKFEKFPGDSNKKRNKILAKKVKKILLFMVVILMFFILLVGSSFLNKKILDNNIELHYKLVNSFNGKYANIKTSDRSLLFKEIGFDASKEEIRNLNNKKYNATYAYHKIDKFEDVYDKICVYYDKNNDVYYISVNLIYENSFLTSSRIVNDINNLLNNFIDINVSKDSLLELINNNYYYNDSSGLKFSMYLSDFFEEGYSSINIIIER